MHVDGNSVEGRSLELLHYVKPKVCRWQSPLMEFCRPEYRALTIQYQAISIPLDRVPFLSLQGYLGSGTEPVCE